MRFPQPLWEALGASGAVSGWAPPASDLPPLILMSQVGWDDVWQRPQEHALRAAAHRTVIYLSPVQIHEWQRNLGDRWKPVQMPLGPTGRLLVLSPLTLSGHYKSAGVFGLNMGLLRRWLEAALARLPGALGAGGVDVLLNTPLLLPLVEQLDRRGSWPRGSRIHYDVIDDFAGFDWAPRYSRNLDRRLLGRAQSLTTGTRELSRRLAAQRPDVVFVPLGVEAELFAQPAPCPPDLAALPHPRIGYFGTLSDRLDYDLLGAVARAYPGGSLVLIGPLRVPDHQLPQGPQVHWLGLRPHGELPAYAQSFDVGLIPFRVNEANRALNPVKALEYLAAGLPVVSTDLPDVRGLHEPPVFVASHQGQPDRDQSEFLHQLERALAVALDPVARKEYGIQAQAHAARMTWNAMARELERRMGIVWPESEEVS